MFKKTLWGAALATASLLTLGPMAAHAQYNGVVRPAPPPPVYEAAPAARPGWIWAGGHYEYREGQYTWVPGEWIRERPGFVYRDPHWEKLENDQWIIVGGGWVPTDDNRYAQTHRYDDEPRYDRDYERGPNGDPDHDGVPNRYDLHPYDPYRR
jgi:hypothetical protein